MKTNKEKKFDAVKMMRQAREKISQETLNMNFEQLKEYIAQKLSKDTIEIPTK